MYVFDLAPVVEWFRDGWHGRKAEPAKAMKEEEKETGEASSSDADLDSSIDDIIGGILGPPGPSTKSEEPAEASALKEAAQNNQQTQASEVENTRAD